MTKKIVAVVALSLAASSAFASQARNLVSGGGDAGNILGDTGMNGSFYTNDSYNMFWNPAFINGQKDWAVVEHGSTSGNAAGNAAGTSGGFVTEIGSMNVGVFLNRPIVTADHSNATRPIDLVVGGDAGVKWGIGLTQALSTTTTNKGAYTGLNAGVVVSDFEPFVNYTLKNSDGATPESKLSNMTVGTRYHYGEWTPYAVYQTAKATSAGIEGDSQTTWGLGLGRMAKLGEIHLNYAMSYWHQSDNSVIPVDMDFSANAASWLVVHAGFSHDLISRGHRTAATSTRVGGTVKMGKADLDMVFGSGGQASSDKDAFGFSDKLFANAGLTYHW